MLFGIPLPVCSCGVVPLYRSLAKKGVPAAAAAAFLVATPELGMDALLISVPFLGVKIALVRLAAAVAVALTVGFVAGRLVPAGDSFWQVPLTIRLYRCDSEMTPQVKRVWTAISDAVQNDGVRNSDTRGGASDLGPAP